MKVNGINLKEKVNVIRNIGTKAKEIRAKEMMTRETKIKEEASETRNKDRVSVSRISKVANRIFF